MGEFGGPWVGPPTAFAPFVPVQTAYISRLYCKASCNEERKKSLHIIQSRYQMGGTTSFVTILIRAQNPKDFAEERLRSSTPQWGRQKSARFFASAKRGNSSAISFPLYSPSHSIITSGRQLRAVCAGIQKGRSPFAHGGVRGTMGRSPDGLCAVCGETNGVYIAVVSQSFVQ